jgi:hypothetical protein
MSITGAGATFSSAIARSSRYGLYATISDQPSDVNRPLTRGHCPHTRLNAFEMKRQERSRHIKKMF